MAAQRELTSEEIKATLIKQVKEENAMQNAKQLIEKVNEHCYTACVPKPGLSLSSGESTCITTCMQKYLQAWNTVSNTYMARIQREQATRGGVF